MAKNRRSKLKLAPKQTGIFGIILVVVVAGIAYWWQPWQKQQVPAVSKPKFTKTLAADTGSPSAALSSQSASEGWHITLYYTAVERYHHGPPEEVNGCTSRDCANGNSELGSYPSDFVEKVKNEGAGLITSGVNTGHYLNWAYDTGYWLDTMASDSNGHPLQPFASAAADTATLAQNSVFRLLNCGSDPSAITQSTCDKLKSATWRVVDHFTPGLGGPQHVDLYIGEENQDDFESSDQVVDLLNVSLHFE